MASGRERILRRRIRSIEATKKITHAMELIAASQIVRAQNRIARNRPYLSGLRDAFRITVDDATEPTRLVGEPNETRRVALLLMVSDRGLAGAYNSSVLRAAERRLGEIARAHGEATLVTVGRRAEGYFRFRRRPVAKTFQKVSERPSFDDARRVSAEVIGPFMAEDVDVVEVISTRFRSAGVQVVERHRLLPVPEPTGDKGEEAETATSGGFYDFEPRSDDLLSTLVPRARRGGDLRGAAGGGGIRAHRPAASDGRGHGQRRRACKDVAPRDEPRSPGRDHLRDHGDRRRSRGVACGRRRAGPL